jgi:hypothetical protein
MDLTSLAGQLAKLGAPILGGALGGPVGAALASTIIGALSDALGVPATPDAVGKAIQTNPQASDIVRQVEVAQAPAVMDELNARLADIQNARATTVKLVEAGSAISWGAPVVSVLVVAGFLALVGGMMFRTVPDSQVALVLFGSLSTAFGSVISYWLGSSAGSKDKDAMLASIAKGGRK